MLCSWILPASVSMYSSPFTTTTKNNNNNVGTTTLRETVKPPFFTIKTADNIALFESHKQKRNQKTQSDQCDQGRILTKYNNTMHRAT